MTDPEYDQWESFHFAAFPSVESWLSKRENSGETRSLWRRVLSGVSLEDAKRATEAILGDVSGQFDKLFDETPRAIKRLCGEYERTRRNYATATKLVGRDDDKQPRYKCRTCEDGDWIVVLNRKAMQFVREWCETSFPDGWERILKENRTYLRCFCWNSDDALARRKETLRGTYDEKIHCVWEPYSEQHYRDWVDSHPVGMSRATVWNDW